MKLSLLGLTTLVGFFLFVAAQAQQVTQTVRGTVSDRDSGYPLAGATVIIVDSDPIVGTVTNSDGTFRLLNVPVGRTTLKVSFVGYEDRVIPNLLINSAKEEILNTTLSESVLSLEGVTVSAQQEKGEAINEMAIASAHTFSVEETQRYAGTFDDPARMVASFAGVVGDPEGNNDIIVRGNSPKGILWRLEGIAIPNPNHYAGEGSTGGPINALSSKMLSNSDFFTGAFAPEYGDVTSGVFDMKLKNGNNEQREYTAAFSTLGIDLTAEGPFKKGGSASYLANYRYSALDLLDKAGVIDFGGVPRYQDASFKFQIPINNKHLLSLFGLSGMSGIDTENEDDGVPTSKFRGRYKLGVAGISHTYQITDAIFLKSSLAVTGTDNSYNYRIPDDASQFYAIEDGKISKSSYIASSTFNYKLNAKHKIESGIILTKLNYNIRAHEWDFENSQVVSEVLENGNSSTVQAFASWKNRVSDKLTVVSGVHYLQFNLNKNYSIEPRIALKWQQSEKQSFNIGMGLHSKLEGLSTYLSINNNDGVFTQPNTNLELSKAAHFIIGYDNLVAKNARIKIETYYQHLFDVPVEDSITSTFSILNRTEGYSTRKLVNAGFGRNYGVEVSFERYLFNGLYYMSTLSLFRSLYTAMDGIERKSAFDNNYVANVIGGKEFKIGVSSKNRVLFVNARIILIGGKRYSPIDLEASIAAGNGVTDEANPFSKKSDDIFRTDFSIGLRRNRERTTSELKLDFQNITNSQTVLGENYIHALEKISKDRQQGLLPNVSYRISF